MDNCSNCKEGTLKPWMSPLKVSYEGVYGVVTNHYHYCTSCQRTITLESDHYMNEREYKAFLCQAELSLKS